MTHDTIHGSKHLSCKTFYTNYSSEIFSVLWLETDTKPLDYFQIQIVKQTMWAAI